MNVFENIAEILGVSDLIGKPVFKATLVGDSAGYFECVSGIKSYTEDQIVLCVKNGDVVIKGQNLYIKKSRVLTLDYYLCKVSYNDKC